MTKEQSEFLESLYRENYPLIVNYAYLSLRDSDRANDIAQQTFAVACRKIQQLISSPNPVGWLINTVKYLTLNEERKQRRYLKTFVALESLQEWQLPSQSDEEDLSLLYGNVLPKEEFDLLRRYIVEGVPCAQLAEEQQVSVWAIYKRLERLIRRFQKNFGEELV